ncbi:COP1-interactive protein 1 isoform X2 [Salvia miltiorrhiza]|uniref:COP1-interactive protein 1 isoform X2 n=1 Tax=Salvia miltiorrhiza TaxID=226208 RepID=UPI0025AD2CD9|nr:COP1-interactive protein 1 isoform X2 [Salvia miltiorrhiza]
MKSFENHIDPEKQEQLRLAKIDVENKVRRILKLAKGINGNKEGNVKKEIIHLVEDFQQHYESLYSLYEDLRGEAKNIVHGRDDSDSEVYYSPVEGMHKNSRETDDESSDVEDTILKDILTSSSEIKENKFFKDLRVEEPEIEIAKKQWQAEQMKERISRLKGRVSELESICKDKECLQHEKDELEERLTSETKERCIEVEGLMEQVDCLHEELVSVTTRKVELELELNHKYARSGDKESSKAQELLRKMSQLQTSLLLSERKLSAQEKKLKQSEEDSSAQIKSLNQKMKNQQSKMEALLKEKHGLQVELATLKTEKQRYLMELEKEKQESLLIKSKMDRKNTELINKIVDQQKTLLELGEVVNKMRAGHMKSHPNFQLMEHKIEEMAEEFRKQFEDKYRALSRRIRAAEKLHVESKEWYLKTNEDFNQQHKAQQGEIEIGLRNVKDISLTANDVLLSLDSVVLKFEECNDNFLTRISKTSCEVNYAKDWVRRKNSALVQVKHDLDDLLFQLDDKEGEILVFRDRVWKLENKMRELEKWIREKDEGMIQLREEKREAIRQLCVWIDYHRCRTDYYKKIIKKMPEINKQRRRMVS